MTNELLTLIGIATIIAPITTGFTELYKRYTPAEGKLLPILAIITAIVLSSVWAFAFHHESDIAIYAFSGVLSGLSATGFYNLIQTKGDGQ